MSLSISIVPENESTQAIIQGIINAPNDEIPIVKMNDQNTQDIGVIWASIDDIATRWRGNQDARIPNYPANRKEYWGIRAAQGYQLLPLLKKFIRHESGDGKLAIDLGCGNSPATKRLLKKGWTVIAVDSSPIALDIMAQKHKRAIKSGQLKLIEANIEQFSTSQPADLVIAADCLFYTDPSQFRATWNKIHDSLVKENGFLIGSLLTMRRIRTSHSKQVRQGQLINGCKEFGAWVLPDKRMVYTILRETGYKIKQCKFRKDPGMPRPICLQFVAKKSNSQATYEVV